MKLKGALPFVAGVITILNPAFPPHVYAQSGPGYALAFNGSNYVSIATTGSVAGTFTVEAWVNPADTNGFSEILSTRVPGEYSFDMQLNSGVGLHGDIGNGVFWVTTAADATFSYASNQWLHVAYVVTPTSYTIYANGQQVGAGTYGFDTPALYNINHPVITLGAWTPTGSLLRGQLDEVRIWNIARSQGQILSNMTVRLAGTEPGLVDYYRFDEPNTVGATALVLDSTGRGNRGQLINRPFRVRSTAPLAETIVLNGANPMTNECHTTFTDPGAGISPRAIAIGNYHGLALTPVGTVVGWGNDGSGQITIPSNATNVVAIAAGLSHSLALKVDGTVVVWGFNGNGETNISPSATNVVAIAAGGAHNLALRADGSIVGWGFNVSGEINVPPNATNVWAVAAGNTHSLALRADGAVIGWGDNGSGQTSIPANVTNVMAIAAGTDFSLALKTNGVVVGWGDNAYGETNIPPSATNVIAIAAGQFHCLALKGDGTVVAWGAGSSGQTNIPPGATNVVAIAANVNHCLAIKADGTIVGWGQNAAGELNIPADVNTSLGTAVVGTVNTNSPGIYNLSYFTTTNVFGAFGKATRTVIVADTIPPQLNLNGPDPIILLQGTPYVEPGATATDLCGGNVTAGIVVTGSVNISILGTNVIGYRVTDASGNSGSTNRLVIVGNKATISGLNSFLSDTNTLTGTRSATFDGSVNPNTQPTRFYYEFGLTTAYVGSSAFLVIPGSLTDTNVPFAANALSFGTTFHWRIVASNYFGTAFSPDQVIAVPSPYKAGDLDGNGTVSQSELALVYSNYLATSAGLEMTNVVGLGSPNVTFTLGNPGVSAFSVEYSTNLIYWQLLGATVPRYLFTDTNAPGNQRFYRLRWP